MVDVPNFSEYVVRNTFVEVVDGSEGEECESIPRFRRHRGSSFFRSSSEPGRRQARKSEEHVEDDVDTECGLSTPDRSPVSSRAGSPVPSPFRVRLTAEPPKLTSEFAAAMHAGFIGGLLAAQNQQCMMPAPVGQMCWNNCQFHEACNNSHMPGSPCLEVSPAVHSSNASATGSEMKDRCHMVWCDHRAFKDTSSELKDELERRSNTSVKTHKTAENCIRLFRKKQRAQGRPPCVILVSWANAPSLLAYLDQANHVTASVVVLCDARSCRKNESAEELAAQYPNRITKVATTWEEAVNAACAAAAMYQSA